ncbi:MAG TPA: hypothetical protein VF143_06620 [Candidatus Nanopelagicales bacterium]
MLAILFIVLLLACALAPVLGADTSDSRSERARPEAGWYPVLMKRN